MCDRADSFKAEGLGEKYCSLGMKKGEQKRDGCAGTKIPAGRSLMNCILIDTGKLPF